MPKQKVKIGQEVKGKCPVCGEKNITIWLNFSKLRNGEKFEVSCYGCSTTFWFYPHIGKITIKKIDKSYD